ncbi:MAG: hypothetical protein K0U84_13460 [Actinomycetia bacterium]|nr:hypothetical protein [Actinomycetes bacterium]
MTKGLGQWCADITAANSRADVAEILEAAPQELRSNLISHARTVAAIRKRAGQKTSKGLETLAALKKQLKPRSR